MARFFLSCDGGLGDDVDWAMTLIGRDIAPDNKAYRDFFLVLLYLYFPFPFPERFGVPYRGVAEEEGIYGPQQGSNEVGGGW